MSDAKLRISLDQLKPESSHSVALSVHPDSFPVLPVAVLGVALTGAAVVIDTWREADPGEGLATSLTLCALLSIAAFRRFAPPHPGLGDLMFDGAMGVISGFILGAGLWRFAGRRLKRKLATR